MEELRVSLEEFHSVEESLVDEELIDDDTRLVDLMRPKSEKESGLKMTSEREQGYIVVHNSGKCKRLHKIEGGCWMARTRRFKSSEEFETMPQESAFTHVCKVCWPSKADEEDSTDESSSESSSSEDSGDEFLSE